MHRVRQYEADCEALVHVVAHVAAYGDRPEHAKLVARALELIANPDGPGGGNPELLYLRRYPALVCMYAAGIAAVAAGRWHVLPAVLLQPAWHDLNGSERLVAAVHPYRVFDGLTAVTQTLASGRADGRHHTPVSDHLFASLREPLRPLVDTDQRYQEAFDRFEYLAGLATTHLEITAIPGRWVPPGYVGAFGWRYRHEQDLPPATWADRNSDTLARAVLADVAASDEAWTTAVQQFGEQIRQDTRTWH